MPSQKKRGGAFSVQFSGKEAQGNLRSRKNTLQAPNVHYTEADPNQLYCLIIWDPDAPHSPSYLHFLVTNIKGGNLSTGKIILPYTPPTPPAGSGVHRYYVGLYSQSTPLSINSMERTGFSIDSFTGQYHLTEVGLKMVKVASD